MRLPSTFIRDLKLPPNMVSLTRLPLAVLFALSVSVPGAAFAVLLAAGLTDVVDGWLARKNGQVTALGGIIDPIADKAFAITVLTTLVVHRMLPLWAVPALLVREILEMPLLLWFVALRRPRGARAVEARANIAGKLATVLQFGAVMSALALPWALRSMVAVAAVAGAFAGFSY